MDSVEAVENILSAWQLDQLIPVFREQKISLDMLETINGEPLQELIPVMGQRMKFLTRRKEYFQNKRQDAGELSLSLESQSSAGSTVQALRPVSTTTIATTTTKSVSISRPSHSSLPSTSSQASSSVSKSNGPCFSLPSTSTQASTSASKSIGSCSQSTPTSSFVKRVAAQFCLNKFIADIDIETVCVEHITADVALSFSKKILSSLALIGQQ